MKIKGSIINGLFIYAEGIPYTRGDIIWYLDDNNPYIVLDNYTGEQGYEPNKASECINFILYHEYSDDNQAEDALITARALHNIIGKYFKGLTGNGRVENILIESPEDLLNYITNGAYYCTIKWNKDSIDMLPDGKYLLKIYSTDTDVIQELVDYKSGFIFYRSVKDGVVNIFSVIPNKVSPGNWKIFTEYLSTTNQKIQHLVDKSNDLLNGKLFNFTKLNITQVDDRVSLGILPINTTVNLCIQYTYRGEVLQYNINIYLTEGTTQMIYNLPELSDATNMKVTISYESIKSNEPKSVLIKLSHNNMKLVNAFSSYNKIS